MATPPTARDEELARLREAIERLEREQPSRFAQVVDALAKLLSTLFDSLFGRLRAEIEGARRAGEEFLARGLRAVSRSLAHIARAVGLALLAGVLATIGLVVLNIALVALLNQRFGDPLGTFAAAGVYLLAAGALALAARGSMRAVADEADALAPPRWR